jgi:hypothetical protein
MANFQHTIGSMLGSCLALKSNAVHTRQRHAVVHHFSERYNSHHISNMFSYKAEKLILWSSYKSLNHSRQLFDTVQLDTHVVSLS